MHSRIIKHDTRTMGILEQKKKRGKKKKKERIETWNAFFLLRFQNITLSNKPPDSF